MNYLTKVLMQGDLFGSKMKILTEQLSEITDLEVGKRLVENFSVGTVAQY
jgi:hypothetical protein